MDMKKVLYGAALAIGLLFSSCTANESADQEFWLGADISWATELEARGHKLYNNEGEERECTALMKELGLNAVRLRVWVDPSAHGNWCDKEDRQMQTCQGS